MKNEKRCCLCGSVRNVYHNPDPLRSGEEDCCDACNMLVRAARRRLFFMEDGAQAAYIARLRAMSHAQLLEELPDAFAEKPSETP